MSANGTTRAAEADTEFGRQRIHDRSACLEDDSRTLYLSGSPSIGARLDFVQDPEEWLYEGLAQVRLYMIFNLLVSILSLGGLLGLLLFLRGGVY